MKATIVLAALACLAATPKAQAATPRRSRIQKPAAAATDSDPLMQAGLTALAGKNYDAAISDFQQLVASRNDGASYFLLGYAHYQRGFASGTPDTADKQDAQQTVNAYVAAIAADPTLDQLTEPAMLWQGLALSYEALGLDENALGAYRHGMRAAPENPLIPLYAARLRLKMKDYDKSIDNLSLCLTEARAAHQEAAVAALIKTSPLFAELAKSPIHQSLIASFDGSGSPAASVAAASSPEAAADPTPSDVYGLRDSVRSAAPIRKPRALTRQDADVLNQLAAATQEYKFRHYAASIAEYKDVLLLNDQSGVLSPPQLAMVHEHIGTALNRLGQTTQAISELRRAVRDMPFDTAAHYQLALAYAVNGQYQDSLLALRETFKTATTPADLRRYVLLAKTDSDLEPIRDLPAFRSVVARYATSLDRQVGL